MLKVLHLPKHLSHCVSVVCVSFLLDSKYLDSMCMWVCALSCLTLCNPMDYSLPGSSVLAFSRQEYWSGLPFPTLGDLLNPHLLHWKADSLPLSHLGSLL